MNFSSPVEFSIHRKGKRFARYSIRALQSLSINKKAVIYQEEAFLIQLKLL